MFRYKERYLWQIDPARVGSAKRGMLWSEDLQFLDQFLQVALGGFFGHDLEHLLSDVADLAGLGVASGSSTLVWLLLGEGDGEHTKDVSVSGADINTAFDQSLPLADQRAKLVAGHVHAVEVGDNVGTLDILADQLDLAESLGFITSVQFGQGDLEDTALKTFRGDLCKK